MTELLNREEEFKAILREKLKPSRYEHSCNVAASAVELAERYGGDKDKAYIAGLLHDIEKNAPFEEQQKYMLQLGDELEPEVLETKKLWHAPAGAAYLRDELGVVDADILGAVKYHTTGRPGMTLLEKIIYVADFISAERDYNGVEEVRETALRDLDEACFVGAEYVLKKLLKKGRLLNADTVGLYNEEARFLTEQRKAETL